MEKFCENFKHCRNHSSESPEKLWQVLMNCTIVSGKHFGTTHMLEWIPNLQGILTNSCHVFLITIDTSETHNLQELPHYLNLRDL